jgi:hypothetical protein
MAKKMTEAEQEQHCMEKSLKDVKEANIHTPPKYRVFKVGDRVQYGRWDYCEILEVCEGGKYYLCYQETKNIEYGKYIGQNKQKRYHKWTTLMPWLPTDYIQEMDEITENDDVRFNFQQRHLESLLSTYYSGLSGLDLNPEYQRGNVWTDAQKIALIDSIFKNVDIGKFAVIRRPFSTDREVYEMLDGKQRFNAVREFYESRFKYKGKYFHELCPRDRGHFRDYSISYAETEPLTPEQKYRYFLKLNTTGTPVDPKHLKKVKELWEDVKKGREYF